MRLFLILIFVLGLTGCAQCGESTPGSEESGSEPATEGSSPAPVVAEKPVAKPASPKLAKPVVSKEHPPGTTGAELIAKAERKGHPSLKALRVASRKLVESDRAIVENQASYQQAVEKTQREMKELGLARRMPSEPLTVEGLRPEVEALVLQSRLKLVELKLGAPSASRAIPETHPGPGPYTYHPDQLIGQQPVSIVVEPADDRSAAALFERLKTAPGALIDVIAVTSAQGDKQLVLSGVIPMLREIDPPTQVVRTPSLSELARLNGVEVPAGDYPTEDVQARLDEHRELLGELKKSMAVLAKTHLLGLQLRFARQRIETNKQRAFPTPMGRLGPNLQKRQ